MRFVRFFASPLVLCTGIFAAISIFSYGSLFSTHMTNVENWNNLGRETNDKVDRVFIQLQIIESQMLQLGSIMQMLISILAFLLSLILLALVARDDAV